MIKNKIRMIKNEVRRHKIASILSNFHGLKNTTSIKTRRKIVLRRHIQDKAGNNKYDRQDIADVFAEFYEELYTSTTKTHEHEDKYEHGDKYEQHQEDNEAVHDARTQRRHQPTLKRQSCRQPPPNWRDTTIKVFTTAVARHHHRTTDPFVRSPLFRSSIFSQRL